MSENNCRTFEEAIHDLFADGKDSPMYDTYVNYAQSTNNRGNILAKSLSRYIPIKNRSYLDIGTAYGGYIVAFAKMNCNSYFGFDIDDRLVDICKLNLRDNNLNPESVMKYDICQPLPDSLKNKKFDIITCTDVLEHVLDIQSTIKNISAMTANGGHIYLEIPNRYHVNNVLSDPHFGLYGITLLDRTDAMEYFKHEMTGEYLVGDYYDLEYFLSYFPKKEHRVINISEPTTTKISDDMFTREIQNSYKEKISKLSISNKLKDILENRFTEYIEHYSRQMDHPDVNRFYVQSWKLIIYKKKLIETIFS